MNDKQQALLKRFQSLFNEKSIYVEQIGENTHIEYSNKMLIVHVAIRPTGNFDLTLWGGTSILTRFSGDRETFDDVLNKFESFRDNLVDSLHGLMQPLFSTEKINHPFEEKFIELLKPCDGVFDKYIDDEGNINIELTKCDSSVLVEIDPSTEFVHVVATNHKCDVRQRWCSNSKDIDVIIQELKEYL